MRDLTPEEVAAMWLWSKEYSQQACGAVEWYKRLDPSRKRVVADFVAQMRKALEPAKKRTRVRA